MSCCLPFNQIPCKSCEEARFLGHDILCNDFEFLTLIGTRQGDKVVLSSLGEKKLKLCRRVKDEGR